MSPSEKSDAVAAPSNKTVAAQSSDTSENTNRMLQSSQVTILVGPQESKFLVHEDVLAKYHCFRKCLAGNFEEATSNVIRMPEEDPTTFAKVLEFVYFSSVPYQLDETALQDTANRNTASKGLVAVYNLADKLCIETLMNALT